MSARAGPAVIRAAAKAISAEASHFIAFSPVFSGCTPLEQIMCRGSYSVSRAQETYYTHYKTNSYITACYGNVMSVTTDIRSGPPTEGSALRQPLRYRSLAPEAR